MQTFFSNRQRLRFTKQARTFVISVSSAVLFTGCATASSGENQADELTDANIAAIVVGANKIDISAGEIALQRSENTEIRQFAQLMVNDHTAVLDSAVELVTKLGVTPIDNDLVATLTEQSLEHEQKLQSLSGNEFDKAYIDHEVSYHEAVIGVLEEQLIPAADNQQLKKTLISVVPAFKAHLEHSKKVQGQL
jgi:putative membrane protein